MEKGKNTKISAMNSKDWETWRGDNHSEMLLKDKWFYLPATAKQQRPVFPALRNALSF